MMAKEYNETTLYLQKEEGKHSSTNFSNNSICNINVIIRMVIGGNVVCRI